MKQEIEESINRFVKTEFQGQFSGDFFSEEDVRSVLYTRLKDDLKNSRRSLPVENLPGHKAINTFETDLVKAEYSYENYEGNSCMAFDIAILHEDQNSWVQSEKWKKYHVGKDRKAQMYWNQPVRFGIEIKAESHLMEITKALKKLKLDQLKMRNYLNSKYCQDNFRDNNNDLLPFEGCAILFFQHENELSYFELVDKVTLGNECNAYCVTPSKIYKVNFLI
jgi:hypothetical protein